MDQPCEKSNKKSGLFFEKNDLYFTLGHFSFDLSIAWPSSTIQRLALVQFASLHFVVQVKTTATPNKEHPLQSPLIKEHVPYRNDEQLDSAFVSQRYAIRENNCVRCNLSSLSDPDLCRRECGWVDHELISFVIKRCSSFGSWCDDEWWMKDERMASNECMTKDRWW